MNSQQEYEMFMAKLGKAIYELQDDFNKLSYENKQRFALRINEFMKGYSRAITVDDLMRNGWWRR